jgi:hypothetical protein
MRPPWAGLLGTGLVTNMFDTLGVVFYTSAVMFLSAGRSRRQDKGSDPN